MPGDPFDKSGEKETLTPSPEPSSPRTPSPDEGASTTAFMGSDAEAMRPLLPEAGEMVLHYCVLEMLGFGGMGVILKARDTKLNRLVALKFLAPQLSRDEAVLRRFYREAQAASALSHPNICTIHDFAEQNGQHFIVMELLEGKTLRECMGKGLLPSEECMRLALAIADALEAAHARGILHRDIKPSNIFLTTLGQLKVLDFGLAKLLPSPWAETEPSRKSATRVGVTMGTINYMSPEQARGETLDVRSDIFSFGTVLYEMSTGVRPFLGKTSALVLDALLHEHPSHPTALNPDLPAGLDRIISRALEKDRNARYQTVTDMKAELVKLRARMDSGLVPAAAALAQAERERQHKRHRLQILGAVLVVLVLLELVAFRVLGLNRPSPSWQAVVALADEGSYNLYLSRVENAATADEALAWVAALRKLGREDQAFGALNRFLHRHPGATAAHIQYARWLVGKKRFDEAATEYEAVLKINPADIDSELALARVNSWNKKYDEGLTHFDKVLRQNPKHYDARVGKAFTLLWMGRKAEARPLLESAQREHPEDAEVAAALRTFAPNPSH